MYISNAISFAPLKVIHSAIIAPADLLNPFHYLIGKMLALPNQHLTIAHYLDSTKLEAFQLD